MFGLVENNEKNMPENNCDYYLEDEISLYASMNLFTFTNNTTNWNISQRNSENYEYIDDDSVFENVDDNTTKEITLNNLTLNRLSVLNYDPAESSTPLLQTEFIYSTKGSNFDFFKKVTGIIYFKI